MLRLQTRKGKQKKPARLTGICDLAKELNVTRQHVWHIVKGERTSPRVEAAARRKWPRYFTHRKKSR